MNAAQENTVWSGTPSQWRNLGLYLLCVAVAIALFASAAWMTGIARTIALGLVLLPLGMAGWRWLATACAQYTLTDQRLILRRGVLNRSSDYVELYRVKDTDFRQSLLQRLFGIGTITLDTTQDSAPFIAMDGMPAPEALWDRIRGLVEARRDAKGVREIDMHSEAGG